MHEFSGVSVWKLSGSCARTRACARTRVCARARLACLNIAVVFPTPYTMCNGCVFGNKRGAPTTDDGRQQQLVNESQVAMRRLDEFLKTWYAHVQVQVEFVSSALASASLRWMRLRPYIRSSV